MTTVRLCRAVKGAADLTNDVSTGCRCTVHTHTHTVSVFMWVCACVLTGSNGRHREDPVSNKLSVFFKHRYPQRCQCGEDHLQREREIESERERERELIQQEKSREHLQ